MSDAKIDVYHIARRLKSCPLRKHKEALSGASNAIGVNVLKFTAFLTCTRNTNLISITRTLIEILQRDLML